MLTRADELLYKLVDEEHRWKMLLRISWRRIVGDLYQHVRIENIIGKTLILGVEHPAWAQEFRMMQDDLQNRVNNFLKGERIKKIRFTTVNFSDKEDVLQRSRAANAGQLSVLSVKSRRYHATLTSTEKQRLANVYCNDLRALLKNFYLSCKRRANDEKDSSD